jgi:type IV pilus assembly protein PilP
LISSKHIRGVLFLSMASAFVGCGEESAVETQENEVTAPTRQAPPSVEIEELDSVTDFTPDPDWSYNPIGMRDPFRSFFVGRQEEDIRSPTPLQRYEIEQLVLQGIVWGVDRPLALVADPEGAHHMVERGTYIGRHWGKVTEITSHSIVITEEYQNDDGELLTDQQVMSLPVRENIY